MFSFKSAAHFLAHSFVVVVKDLPKIAAGLGKAEKAEPVVEGVTVAIGEAPLVPLEDAAFAVLGGLVDLINSGDVAIAKKLADLGLDEVAIQKAQAVSTDYAALVAVSKSMKK